MKIMLLIIILLSALAVADKPKYEFSPIVGYNVAEGNLKIQNNRYSVLGLEIQGNIHNLKLSPELSILYSNSVKYNSGQSSNIFRVLLNGIYTFETIDSVTPFIKIGVGYETLNNENSSNKNDSFMDTGIGAKIKLTQNLALKLETVYINKHAVMTYTMFENRATDNNLISSNFLTLIGLTFTFGTNE